MAQKSLLKATFLPRHGGCRDRWPSYWRARRNRLFMRCAGSWKRLRDAHSFCVVDRGFGRRVAPLGYLESLIAAVVLSS